MGTGQPGLPIRVATAITTAVELARPGNVLMAGAGVLIGALVAGATSPTLDVGLALAATLLVTAGGNALNDLLDHDIDRFAHPERPIPSGRATPALAMGLTGTTWLLAIALAAAVSLPVLVVVALAEALLASYEILLKESGLVGNLTVALLVAATFLVGALAHGSLTPAVGFLSGSALLANVAREVWKDSEDAPHDRGRRTLAQRWGPVRAHRVAQGATVGAVILSPLPLIYGFGGLPFALAVALADLVFLSALITTSPGTAQRRSKLGMLAALIAFTVGAFA